MKGLLHNIGIIFLQGDAAITPNAMSQARGIYITKILIKPAGGHGLDLGLGFFSL